ncbi:MAG: winged helix-turn-helix domain-containing tetratricopeptide repeat protein [Pyrinomonadaceae bacterium]
MSLKNSSNFLRFFSGAEMNGIEKHTYRFKSFLLNVSERQLLCEDISIPLTPKDFDVLVFLVERAGHLVEKDEILQSVWRDSFVEEGNLSRSIHTLRRALGQDKNGNKFIETVPTKGYRFVAEVNVSEPGTVATGFLQPVAKNPVATAPGSDLHDETPAQTTALPKHKTRIILFTVGFASAIALIFLLSFNFESKSSVSPDEVKSIAVLPLKPLTAENRDSIYELGIADSLILKLSSVKNLIVRPLAATRRYADIEQDPLAAGKEQKVDYVLASNYQIADGKIRITSQLVNVQSGLVEETFKDERVNSDGFAVQDAVAANIGQSLVKKLNREPNSLLAQRYTTNEEAYRLYLLGTALADKRHQEEVRKAVEYFKQAILLDPNYALAYAGLANAHAGMALNRSGNNHEQYAKAKAAIEKALAIDETLAEAHSYLGEIKTNYDWDFAGAEREHKRAIELNPNSSAAHRMYALMLGFLGRSDESIAEIRTAIDLEPASVLNHYIYGQTLSLARRYDEAITQLERTAEMDPGFYFTHLWLTHTYRFKGDNDQAFQSFIKTRTIGGAEPDEINSWRTIYAKSGWRGIAERQLEDAKANEQNGKPHYMQLAFHSIESDQNEQAFDYLEKAISQRPWAMTTLKTNPRFDPLRSDPRFDELVRRVGLK